MQADYHQVLIPQSSFTFTEGSRSGNPWERNFLLSDRHRFEHYSNLATTAICPICQGESVFSCIHL